MNLHLRIPPLALTAIAIGLAWGLAHEPRRRPQILLLPAEGLLALFAALDFAP